MFRAAVLRQLGYIPCMPYLLIAIFSSLAVIVISLLARVPTYRVSPVFLVPLIWLPYWIRRPIHLHPLHYALLCSAILLHELGAFGFYQRWAMPFSFDIVVHFWFAFAATLIARRAIRRTLPLGRWQTGLAALLLVMGGGALHEVIEYGSYLLLGEEKGMLKPSSSYSFDTQRDLLSNLVGALVALMLISVWKRTARRAARPKATVTTAVELNRAD
ncbi:DUF2238 domain-containing protein [Fontivita pretiosa]|uniref:DUF2238 domain-containing protein n=1 Tax=Fontivita pretiosa TaxID=2989684 RepID=UPI003D163C7E